MLDGDGPIVMVDDNDSDLMVAERCYTRSKLARELVLLKSGEELLVHLDAVERREEAMPSLVLLDINMPAMDGFETLSALRARPAFRNLPVVMMLTNSDNPKDITRAKGLGASAYHVKPLRVAEYVEFFDSLVGAAG